MGLDYAKIKSLIATASVVVSAFAGTLTWLNNYIHANFVTVDKYEYVVYQLELNVLENRKLALENRLYTIGLCQMSAVCKDNNSIMFEKSKIERELSSVYVELSKKK